MLDQNINSIASCEISDTDEHQNNNQRLSGQVNDTKQNQLGITANIKKIM